MAGSKKAKTTMKKRMRKWERPLTWKRKRPASYHTADLLDPKFNFLFQNMKQMHHKCSFCSMDLDNEVFFYKMGKAVTRSSVIAYGDTKIKPESYLICRQCWREKGLERA